MEKQINYDLKKLNNWFNSKKMCLNFGGAEDFFLNHQKVSTQQIILKKSRKMYRYLSNQIIPKNS